MQHKNRPTKKCIGIRKQNTDKVKCVLGLKQTIRDIIMLSDEISKTCEDVNAMLIGKLNQIALENAFCRFRAQGNNNHLSVRGLRSHVAKYSCQKKLKFKVTLKNCEQENDQFLFMGKWNKKKPYYKIDNKDENITYR